MVVSRFQEYVCHRTFSVWLPKPVVSTNHHPLNIYLVVGEIKFKCRNIRYRCTKSTGAIERFQSVPDSLAPEAACETLNPARVKARVL